MGRKLRRQKSSTKKATRRTSPNTRCLNVEHLEDRRLLAAVTVTNNLDLVNGDTSSIPNLIATPGADGISLREAIEAANTDAAADTIDFDLSLSGDTIFLTLGELVVANNLQIDGPAGELLTIDASGNDPTPGQNIGDGSRVFNVDDGDDGTILSVTLSRLEVTGGDVNGTGGGINTRENLSIIDSLITANSATGDHFDEVFSGGGGVSGEVGNITVSGSTISDNSTSLSWSHGGGIYSGTYLTITDSTITGNATLFGSNYPLPSASLVSVAHAVPRSQGGGIYARNLTLTNTSVVGNSTQSYYGVGGGIVTEESAVIVGSTISDNATYRRDAEGGGIYATGSLSIEDSTISNNSTYGDQSHGGGISAHAILSITNSTVEENFTRGNSAGGGGLHLTSSGEIASTTFNDNYTVGSDSFGGGIYATGALAATSSTIEGNNTSGVRSDGGGVWAAQLTLQESTVSGNASTGTFSIGGGVYIFEGPATIVSSTVTNNRSRFLGGGINSSFGEYTSIANSIVFGNSLAPDNLTLVSSDLEGNFLLGNSFVGSSEGTIMEMYESVNYFGIDPLLGPLTNNGGPTKTHALLAGSPAIDAGGIPPELAADFIPPAYDQRGAPFRRIADGNAGTISQIDIGAYEVPDTLIVTTHIDEFDGNIDPGTGGAMSLREAIVLANLAPKPININFAPSLDATTIQIDQLNLGALPSITNNLSIDASNLPGGLTIHAGHGLDGVPGTFDGRSVLSLNGVGSSLPKRIQLTGLTLSGGDFSAGGGISSILTNIGLIDTIITENAAAFGGGVHQISGDLDVHASIISNNSVSGAAITATGGGIRSFNSNIKIVDSAIYGNSAMGTTAAGAAAISLNQSQSSIIRSTIYDNHASANHTSVGSIWSRDSDVLLSHSSVSNNTHTALEEPLGGGGIHIDDGSWTIEYSTISGNSTFGSGGGIYSGDSQLIIRHSTITGNYAPEGKGSGIYGISNQIFSSIIAGNVNSDLDGIEGGFNSGGYNLIGTGSSVTSFNQPGDQVGILDPRLGPLADNGGPTKTHALLPGSPAIDAGNSTLLADQRGLTAPVDLAEYQNTPSSNGRDIGAYEAQTPPSADFDNSGNVSGLDFLAWQRGFGSTDATKHEGNSDDDTDADASDLAAWSATFGEGPPAAAPQQATTAEPEAQAVTLESIADFRIAQLAQSQEQTTPPNNTSTKRQRVDKTTFNQIEPIPHKSTIQYPATKTNPPTTTTKDHSQKTTTTDEAFAQLAEELVGDNFPSLSGRG